MRSLDLPVPTHAIRMIVVATLTGAALTAVAVPLRADHMVCAPPSGSRASAPTQASPPPGGPESAAPVRIDSALTRGIDRVVQAVLSSRNVPGAAVAVLRHDTVLVMAGYGVTDLERGTRVTSETVFQLASTTKPFTATAVLMLADQGRVNLDAPAACYVRWLPARYAGITVRQLLTHTSGVAPDMRRANVDELSEAEFQRRFAERPASFPPGSAWQYANAGYTLLSEIVEAVSGETFGDILRRRIFAPLGMRHTRYRASESGDALHAVGYDLVNGKLQRAPHVFSGWGNSGIESSVADMARWAAALERGALLQPESYRVMFTPARLSADTAANFPFRGARSSYGFGWFLTTYRGVDLVTHGGAIAGFSSVVHRFPRAGWTVVVLSNGKQGADRQNQADVVAAAVIDALGIVPVSR